MILSRSKCLSSVRQVTVLFGLLMVQPCSQGDGGSLVDVHLAGLQSVRPVILGSASNLGYMPLPGFERTSFSNAVLGRVERELRRGSLRSDASAEQVLLFSFSKTEYRQDYGKIVALWVSLELREPAVLVREFPTEDDQANLVVTSWRDYQLFVVRQDEAVEVLIEGAGLLAARFVQEVASTKAILKQAPAD